MSVLWKCYVAALNRHPWKTQALTTGVLMASGDVISQFVVEKKSLMQYDRHRTTRFFLFGTFLLVCIVLFLSSTLRGPTLRKWYITLETVIKWKAPAGLAAKIAADQLLFAPTFLCSFLATMTLWSTRSTDEVVKKLKKDYGTVLLANYKLWPAAQMVNFYLIPLQHRVMYVNIVALFWNTYLAYKSSQQ